MQTSDKRWPHGAYIRARRLALGLSQPGLARAARCTPAMINRLESGNRRGRPQMLRAVAEGLQVPASELLERAGYAAEARHWREREAGLEVPDPVVRCRNALSALPLRPTVCAALITLVQELARDCEREYQERFDGAAARLPSNAAPFAALREVLFGGETALTPEPN